MIRPILVLFILLCSNSTFARSTTYKRSIEDINCLNQFAIVESNPTNENIKLLLDYLMVYTSHSKLSLKTINHCTSEIEGIINSHDSLKSNKYFLDYYNAILTYCKGDSIGFVNKIESLKFALLKSNRLVEYASINVQAGNFFSLYNVIDLRFRFYRDNIRLFNKYKNTNWHEYDIQNYNSIGFLFENIFQYDSALKYYNIGLKIAERNNSVVWHGLMSGNMGVIYLKLKNYEQAENLLLKDLDNSKKSKLYESALNVTFELIEIKNHQKKYNESKQLLDSAYFYYSLIDTINNFYPTIFTNRINFSRAEIFMGTGQYDSAKYYYRKANDFLYSLNKGYRKREKTLLNKRYNFEENAIALNELEIKNRQTIFIAIISILLFISAIITLIILSRLNKSIKQKTIELEELSLQKDKLFSIISHDLKSPLNTLHSLLDLYNLEAINDEDFLKYKGEINSTINEISGNLNNLLLWASKSMKSGVKVENSRIDLSELINDVITQSSVLIKNKNLILSIDNQFSNSINVDRNMLFVVLNNLINNSIKFTIDHQSIIIKAYQINSSNIQIEIQDQGIGISKDKLDSIFTLSANKSTMGTSGEKGTGLGLIICNDFIKLMGGTIKAESEINKGSKFIITLPVS